MLNFRNNSLFIHPYNDIDIIQGQGTIAYEIEKEIKPDIIISCIGGGGLISGMSLYLKTHYPNSKVYGVESQALHTLQT